MRIQSKNLEVTAIYAVTRGWMLICVYFCSGTILNAASELKRVDSGLLLFLLKVFLWFGSPCLVLVRFSF